MTRVEIENICRKWLTLVLWQLETSHLVNGYVLDEWSIKDYIIYESRDSKQNQIYWDGWDWSPQTSKWKKRETRAISWLKGLLQKLQNETK